MRAPDTPKRKRRRSENDSVPLAMSSNGPATNRLLILGLDGGTFDLIRPWVEQGRMPTFARIMREGSWCNLKSVPNINTAPAWTSFMTGKNPGKHGIFWFAEEGDEVGEVRFVTAADRRSTTLWRLLSDGGHKLCVMNVPLTYPVEQIDGVMVAGFDAPSVASRNFTHPEGLMTEVQAATGAYRLNAAVAGHASAGRRDRVVAEALRAEESRLGAALYLMSTKPWDTFMFMIKATDQAAHYLWDRHSESQEALWPIYEYADRALARLLNTAGSDCGLIIMSDHGMGWRQPAAEFLNDILSELGYVKRRAARGQGSTWRAFRLAKRLGPRVKGLLKTTLPGLYSRFGYKVRFGNIDWSGTRAYCDNTRSCIWINLDGRNPNGIVEREGYDSLVEELREVVRELTDPATGAGVVGAVWRPEEIYSGPHVHLAPDLQIDWLYERPVEGLAYKGRFGEVESRKPAKGFMNNLTGAHRPLGVLLMHGPQFKASAEIDGARLEDLAPTVLHLAGVPIPDDMDGRVLAEALAEPYASWPPTFGAPGEDGPTAAAEYSAEEAAEVEERLRALGYL
ncbi:MAG: alkaline phosphatase family protein [Actinomycetota bacterium]